MPKRENVPKLNRKQSEWLFYGSLLLLALFVFLFVGSREPVLFDDSGSYMRVERFEGVMPVYPLFLLLNQYLFGSDSYLKIVIVEQALVAAGCLLLFVREIKEKFKLRFWEGYLIFFLSLLSFTTEMPEAMITQTILTEGLAYALFYLLMILYLRAIWRNSYRFLAASFGMVYFLAMLRSQLQILFGVCGVLFLYLTWKRCDSIGKKVGGFLAGIVGCMVISVAGIGITAATVNQYNILITENARVNLAIMRIQDPEYYQEFSLGEDGADRELEEVKEAVRERQEEDAFGGADIRLSQYTSLLFSRGMYEADAEDADYFTDETVRELYRSLYKAVDQEQRRYAYEERSLWIWKDIVGGIGTVGKICIPVGNEFYQENYPEIYAADNFNEIWNRSLQTIGVVLIRKHFGRFLYHTFMMLPQAFICTVFFQIKQVYLLCHIITLFLYLSAVVLVVWGYADKRTPNPYAEFMALVLGSNVVMVLIISLVFFGQQRYLVYNFGIFYIAYYLLLRMLWKVFIRDQVMGKILWKADRNL